MQVAETVGKAGSQQFGHLAPLLVGEARRAAVGAGVLQVDLLVGHVQVTADDHRLFGVQVQQVSTQVILPLHAVVNAGQFVLGVGHIQVHQIEVLEFQGDGPALMAVGLHPDAVPGIEGLQPGVDQSAGIALLLGTVDVFGIAFRLKVRLAGLHLGLLQADGIGVKGSKGFGKALFQAGTKAVHVPADEFFHGRILSKTECCIQAARAGVQCFFQAPVAKRSTKQSTRKIQSTTMAIQTPTAPMPIWTQRI